MEIVLKVVRDHREVGGGYMNSLPELLLRLLIGALAYWLGEKIIGLVKDSQLQSILNVILIIAVVLYVIFGSFLPFVR